MPKKKTLPILENMCLHCDKNKPFPCNYHSIQRLTNFNTNNACVQKKSTTSHAILDIDYKFLSIRDIMPITD